MDWSHPVVELLSETVYWRRDKKKNRREGRCKELLDYLKQKMVMKFERRSTMWYYMEIWLWKNLWASRKTYKAIKE